MQCIFGEQLQIEPTLHKIKTTYNIMVCTEYLYMHG